MYRLNPLLITEDEAREAIATGFLRAMIALERNYREREKLVACYRILAYLVLEPVLYYDSQGNLLSPQYNQALNEN